MGAILFQKGKAGIDWLRRKAQGPVLPPTQPLRVFSIPPTHRGLWLLLYDLVRHWLVLEPGVFIQDRLHSETLDVYVIQVKDLKRVCWPQNSKCDRSQLRASRSVLLGQCFYSIIKSLASYKVLTTNEHVMGFISLQHYHLATLSQSPAPANRVA